MTTSAAAHHLLLVLSLAALGAAGLRVASLAAPSGLERAVAAIVLAAAAAALEALLLGLVRLGTNPVALALVAVATWGVARARLAAPAVPLRVEPAEAWRAAPLTDRLVMGAALGAWLAWTFWLVRYPALGIDSVGYHLPEIVGWIGNGSPGAVEPVFPSLPIGNYPLTNEVLLAWGSGIGRSFAFVALWCPALILLLAAASWGALRRLLVGALPAALAVAALCLTPVLTNYQMNGANTDLPALTWLVCSGFLALASLRRPALLAVALVAAGLAVGTKTTTLPLAVTALAAVGLLANRDALRGVARPLALGALAAVAVGGYWYLRNLVDHGSPLWPFVATPWGDELPAEIGPRRGVNSSFLDRPDLTLDRVGDAWLDLFGAGFLLLGGALLAGLLARSRAVTAGAVATAASALIWAGAPFTGASVRDFEVATISTVRYLLPALAAALLTLALAAGSPRREARALSLLLLATGVALGALQTFDLGFPEVPSPATPLIGALAGAALAMLASRRRIPALSLGRPGLVLSGASACILAALALARVGDGFVERHASAAHLFGTDTVRWFVEQAKFDGDGRTIAGAPIVLGPLAGDSLEHRFEWVPPDEPCARVRARRLEGWVLVLVLPNTGTRPARTGRCLSPQRPAFEGLGFTVYGG